jgi:dextranase
MPQKKLLPYIIDVYTDLPQYKPDSEIKIITEIHNPLQSKINAQLHLNVAKNYSTVFEDNKNISLNPESSITEEFTFKLQVVDWQGYGVDVSLQSDDSANHKMSTAFDIAARWDMAPRYGFITDFYEEDENDGDDISQMAKYHLNVIQFYDWMYKHEDLIPKENYFIDPLDRKISTKSICNKLKLCHNKGMTVLAYGAIYGASEEFSKKHAEWAFYNNVGQMHGFEKWIKVMNITGESPWSKHIIGEFKKAIEQFDFDGIHMDTYGFPKTAFSNVNNKKKLVNLKDYFPEIIANTRKELETVKKDIGLIFNAVSSWGVDTIAPAQENAVYIEVWDPFDRYFHLYDLINTGKRLGKDKQVILAAYYQFFSDKKHTKIEYAENSYCLASAVIFASGGYQILLGEENGLLTEGYYVRHANIRQEFQRVVRNYYDFIVRYANLLYDLRLQDNSMTYANGINTEYAFENGTFSSCGEQDKVWTIIKEMPGIKTINLINFTGIKSDIWNEEKQNKPTTMRNIRVKALIDEPVKGVYVASPDSYGGISEKIEYEYVGMDDNRGRYIQFTIPKLEVWNLIYLEVEEQ